MAKPEEIYLEKKHETIGPVRVVLANEGLSGHTVALWTASHPEGHQLCRFMHKRLADAEKEYSAVLQAMRTMWNYTLSEAGQKVLFKALAMKA
jgi:hypothetical protein